MNVLFLVVALVAFIVATILVIVSQPHGAEVAFGVGASAYVAAHLPIGGHPA